MFGQWKTIGLYKYGKPWILILSKPNRTARLAVVGFDRYSPAQCPTGRLR